MLTPFTAYDAVIACQKHRSKRYYSEGSCILYMAVLNLWRSTGPWYEGMDLG